MDAWMLTSGPVGGGLAGVGPVPLTSDGGWIRVEKQFEDTIETDAKRNSNNFRLRNAHFFKYKTFEAISTCVLFYFNPVYIEITISIS